MPSKCSVCKEAPKILTVCIHCGREFCHTCWWGHNHPPTCPDFTDTELSYVVSLEKHKGNGELPR